MKYKLRQLRFNMGYYMFMSVFYLMFNMAVLEYMYLNYIDLFENDVHLILCGFCFFTAFFIGVHAMIKFNHNRLQYKRLKVKYDAKNDEK